MILLGRELGNSTEKLDPEIFAGEGVLEDILNLVSRDIGQHALIEILENGQYVPGPEFETPSS